MEDVSKPQSEIFGNPINKPELPNATAILVLGIISLVGCFCYGVIGLVCGIIALVMASKAKKLNPELYSESSVKNMNAGRICAIIGTSVSALYILILIGYLIFMGSMLSTMPWQNFR